MDRQYLEWIRLEATRIGSDGCSIVSEWNKDCCLIHDLAYYFHKDPEDAFLLGWDRAKSISKWQADADFMACNASRNPPRAIVRWLGVTLGGWWAWLKRRPRNGARR